MNPRRSDHYRFKDDLEKLMLEAVPHPVCGGLTAPDRSRIGSGYIGIGTTLAHRLVWEAEYGPLKKGQRVRHSCGQRDCFDLEHLYAPEPKRKPASRPALSLR